MNDTFALGTKTLGPSPWPKTNIPSGSEIPEPINGCVFTVTCKRLARRPRENLSDIVMTL